MVMPYKTVSCCFLRLISNKSSLSLQIRLLGYLYREHPECITIINQCVGIFHLFYFEVYYLMVTYLQSSINVLTMGDTTLGSAAKLQLERENLAWLKEQCDESEKLTTGMVDILESFETRLGKLEQTILPVYQETGNLQRRQENIEKTLQELDHVINYYNVSKEVENVVREGPNGTTLQNFLDAMRKLKVALDYFSTNNPGSIELENVRSLYTTGGSALFREFRDLLEKHSRPITPTELMNTISANDSVSGDEISHTSSDDFFTSMTQFPEDVQTNLIQIAEWLVSNDREEYMNIYANIRAHMMKKSLETMRDHQKTASLGSQGRGVSPTRQKIASPAAAIALAQVGSTLS